MMKPIMYFDYIFVEPILAGVKIHTVRRKLDAEFRSGTIVECRTPDEKVFANIRIDYNLRNWLHKSFACWEQEGFGNEDEFRKWWKENQDTEIRNREVWGTYFKLVANLRDKERD